MRRILVAVVVLALLGAGLVAAGLLGGQRDDPERTYPPAPPEAGSEQPPSARLAAFYGQQLDWQPCGDEECARLTVPLDYDRPEGRTIELALLRVPARAERLGALVVNPGGPGAPGTEYAAAAGAAFGQPLLEHLDVVGFDPRGTGDSVPVDCLSDDELDARIALDPSPDDAAERQALVRSAVDFGRGCVADDADLAAHVSTIETARDMDVLRSALGRAELDYFGASYGTSLGATYAELFPERVGRFVLDGAVDVSATAREANLGQARGFETALRAYVENCVDTVDSCFLGDSVDEGLGRITEYLEQVDAEPLAAGDGRQVTVGTSFYGIVTPLYVREYWPILSVALRRAFDGNGGALQALADLYTSRDPAGGFTDNSSEANLAINCLDDPTAIPPRAVADELPAFRKASPTFGDVFAWSLITCAGQVAESTEDPIEIDGSGAAPIVVIGTTRDPATPYEWAQALADQLDSAVLVTRDGDGHTGYHAGNDCVDDAVESFLLEGTVPTEGLTC
ncbi:alpha/beta hydrolase [Nocardioides sp.]|uniref:alpha/beta hydrolase n=1 Tax=Nocardioides sp. TaxID=35761 RepID=UPI002ED2AD36